MTGIHGGRPLCSSSGVKSLLAFWALATSGLDSVVPGVAPAVSLGSGVVPVAADAPDVAVAADVGLSDGVGVGLGVAVLAGTGAFDVAALVGFAVFVGMGVFGLGVFGLVGFLVGGVTGAGAGVFVGAATVFLGDVAGWRLVAEPCHAKARNPPSGALCPPTPRVA